MDNEGPRIGCEVGQRDVLGNRHVEQKAGTLAVLGYQEQALLDGHCRSARDKRLAVETDDAGQKRFDPENRPGEFGPARPDQPSETQYLAAMHREIQGFARKSAGFDAFKFKRASARSTCGGDVKGFQVTPDHQLDHRIVRDVLLAEMPNHLAVAHDNRPVSAFFDFAEPVRNKDDAHALRFQPGDDVKQAAGFRECQTRRRLVHDHKTGVERQGLHDFEKLPLRDRQVGDRRRWQEIHAEAIENRFGIGVKPFAVDQLQRPA